ncbi:HAD family hydrolase [Aliamphritea ceti]|uniref:HAD family hydrolase n=1 Tax=Aliamphritea ceti TaxID=1524258 RepID=UPI0021C4B806|nr:HAD family hydrolase [Aliamphritea ceti]
MALRIFDLDETITCCDTSSLFCEYLKETGLVTDPGFVAEEQRLMDEYARGSMSVVEYIRFQMKPLADMNVADIDHLTERFVADVIVPKIYPQAKVLLSELRSAGHRVVIVSATATFIVRAVGKQLGVDEVLAIDLCVDGDDCYTGEIDGVPTYKEGKVTRLNAWLEAEQESLKGAAFYSDSMNDLPLLEVVEQPVATNPDPRLAVIARERNWAQLNWTI